MVRANSNINTRHWLQEIHWKMLLQEWDKKRKYKKNKNPSTLKLWTLFFSQKIRRKKCWELTTDRQFNCSCFPKQKTAGSYPGRPFGPLNHSQIICTLPSDLTCSIGENSWEFFVAHSKSNKTKFMNIPIKKINLQVLEI